MTTVESCYTALVFSMRTNYEQLRIDFAEALMGRSVTLTIHRGAARPLPADWRRLLAELPEDLLDLYEERAALIEYDGGEKRKTAERRAFECVIGQSEAAAGIYAAFCARKNGSAGESAARVS